MHLDDILDMMADRLENNTIGDKIAIGICAFALIYLIAQIIRIL